MVGETNHGTCLREAQLWYGGKKVPCPMPLSDGSSCGDRSLRGPRCPYNRNGLTLDTTNLVYITYPQCNARPGK